MTGDLDSAVASSPDKRAYVTPQLIRYGAVRDLAQSGAISPFEATTSSGHCSRDTGRKSCVPSDRRLKDGIIRVGTHPLGLGLYLFDYKAEYQDALGRGRRLGVMADEVQAVLPEAVCRHPDGYMMVDYALLAIPRDERESAPAS